MQPSEEQIVELMSTVSCTVCGARYRPTGVEVLGRRDALWFLRVSCTQCASRGLIAAMVSPVDDEQKRLADQPASGAARRLAPNSDRALRPRPIAKSDVTRMRKFLAGFDGDFQSLFRPNGQPASPNDAA